MEWNLDVVGFGWKLRFRSPRYHTISQCHWIPWVSSVLDLKLVVERSVISTLLDVTRRKERTRTPLSTRPIVRLWYYLVATKTSSPLLQVTLAWLSVIITCGLDKNPTGNICFCRNSPKHWKFVVLLCNYPNPKFPMSCGVLIVADVFCEILGRSVNDYHT